MPNLLWPGDHRAGVTFTDATVVSALLRVERAWLVVLTNNHIAPPEANVDLPPVDVATLAIDSEDAGNPVVSLVAHVRERLGEPAASWVHRGLTSQDVLDSAMMLCAQDALDTVLDMVRRQLMTLIELAEHHPDTPMLARTLTQPALPTTFGVHVSGWIQSLADAAETVTGVRERLCIQAGGAAGTMAAAAQLAQATGAASPGDVAMKLANDLAAELGLNTSPPWHSSRAAVTGIGDGLTRCCDAWGRIARDVLQGSRAESGELTEPVRDNRGVSSTMPHKTNPVLSILLHRTAIAAPGLASTLHSAAAAAVDSRPDGSWHAEWDTLRHLARRTVVAADHATELLGGLTVHTEAMAKNLEAVPDLNAEQESIAEITGIRPDGTSATAIGEIIDVSLDRARALIEGRS